MFVQQFVREMETLAARVYGRLTFGALDRGASLVEYTLLLLLIVVVALGSLRYFGESLTGSLGHSTNSISNAVKNGS